MVLKEQEASGKTAEVSRRHGISTATFYKWKARYDGKSAARRRIRNLQGCCWKNWVWRTRFRLNFGTRFTAAILGLFSTGFQNRPARLV